MEDKEKEIIVDEEKTEETPAVETPEVEIEPDSFMKILEAIADLKGDVANLIQKSEAIESPLEEPPAEETPEENSEEAPPEEESTEISEEEQEDISDMFKD